MKSGQVAVRVATRSVDEPGSPVWRRIADLIRHLPFASIASIGAVALAGAVLDLSGTLPAEVLLPVVAALEVVFLTNAIQRIVDFKGRRRRLGLALWELHEELYGHITDLNRKMKGLTEGTKVMPGTPDAPKSAKALQAWDVQPFPSDSWSRFLTAGGLNELRDVVPIPIAANLYSYYRGIALFNDYAARRNRVLERVGQEALEPDDAGAIQLSANVLERRMREVLEQIPTALFLVSRQVQHVLFDLGIPPGSSFKGPGETHIPKIMAREDKRFKKWQRTHGDPTGADIPDVLWDWSAEMSKKR